MPVIPLFDGRLETRRMTVSHRRTPLGEEEEMLARKPSFACGCGVKRGPPLLINCARQIPNDSCGYLNEHAFRFADLTYYLDFNPRLIKDVSR